MPETKSLCLAEFLQVLELPPTFILGIKLFEPMMPATINLLVKLPVIREAISLFYRKVTKSEEGPG